MDSLGGIDIYQCKFFPLGLGESQKEQIRRSFRTRRDSDKFKVKCSTLCLPRDLSTDERKWFDQWRAKETGSGGRGIDFDPVGA